MKYAGLASAQRIAVIGCGGAGKSTLAAGLGAKLHLPVIYLDVEYWQPGWVAMEPDRWGGRMSELVAQASWVMEGHFPGDIRCPLSPG